MKQKKVKKELVLTTYKDYVRHYGVKEGAKRWKRKESPALEVSKPKKVAPSVPEPTEEVKEVEVEKIPLEKARDDVEYRGREISKMLRTKGWYKFLKPEIELIIKQYKDQYDGVRNIVDLRVNQKIREILQAILDYPKDCLEDAEVIRKERKEKQDALDSVGQESA